MINKKKHLKAAELSGYFIGCPIPTHIINSWHQSMMQNYNLQLSNNPVVNDSNIHMTLLFLGDIADNQLTAVIQSINNCVMNKHIFSTQALKIDLFPSPKGRIIAAYLRLNLKLALLYRDLKTALSVLQLKADKKSFRPHVTLARLDQPLTEPYPAITFYPNIEIAITHISLYESITTSQGLYYNPIHTVELNN